MFSVSIGSHIPVDSLSMRHPFFPSFRVLEPGRTSSSTPGLSDFAGTSAFEKDASADTEHAEALLSHVSRYGVPVRAETPVRYL